jgi:hypothetical protein
MPRKCDVFGTTDNVKLVCVTVFEVAASSGGTAPEGDKREFTATANLSPRALCHLLEKIEDGLRQDVMYSERPSHD